MARAQTDLTQGSVIGMLVRYALPIITTSLLQSTYSIVDMLIVSRFLGEAGASAVSNAGQVIRVVTNIVIGLCTGGGILIGQYFGNRQREEMRRVFGTFCSLFALLGALMATAVFLLSGSFVQALRSPAAGETLAYLRVSAPGILFIFGYNTLASSLRSVGNSRTPLYCILLATVTNLILDLVLIRVVHMGVAGAALATVISQCLSMLLALAYLLRQRELFSFRSQYLRIRRDPAGRILKIGVPCAVQMSIAGISWLIVLRQINAFGVIVSAGNGIAVKIRDFPHIFLTSMSTGTSSMIAQTLGAKLYDRAKEVMYTAMKLTFAIAAALVLLIELLAPWAAALFTGEAEVVRVAVLNLRIEILAELPYAIFLIYHSLMMGAGHTWWVMASSFANCILARTVLSLWLGSQWGITGIFIACAIAPVVSIPIGYFYTRSGRWRRAVIT